MESITWGSFYYIWRDVSSDLTFEIIVRLHTAKRPKSRETPMSEQSKSLAERLKAKEDAERTEKQEQARQLQTQNEKILRDDKVLEKEAPNLWRVLSDEIQSQCDEFNKEPQATRRLSVNRQVLNRVTVSYADANNVTKELRVSFDHKSYKISISGLYLSQTPPLTIKVLPGDAVPSIVADNEQSIDLKLTVNSWLEQLFGLQ